jgi:hypothetical protein
MYYFVSEYDIYSNNCITYVKKKFVKNWLEIGYRQVLSQKCTLNNGLKFEEICYLDISGGPTPTSAVMKLPIHTEGLVGGGPIESTKGPAFVRNDFFKGTAELTDFGGIFWIPYR